MSGYGGEFGALHSHVPPRRLLALGRHVRGFVACRRRPVCPAGRFAPRLSPPPLAAASARTGGFDSGGTPSRGGGSSDGSKPRRNYDEQTLIPVTIKMVLSALGDPSGGGDLSLLDGRPLHMVKLVVAVRSHEERSTNVFLDVEDGTGFVQVKCWVNDGDECSAQSKLRQAAMQDHTYIRVIGQVKDFDGQRQIVANDVRPIKSGNELTHHLLEVAYSHERGLKMKKETAGGVGMQYGVGSMNSGTAPPHTAGVGAGGQGYGGGMGGGNGPSDLVLRSIKEFGEAEDSGVHLDQIIQRATAEGLSEAQVRNAISHLSNEGHIYSTIDDSHYQVAE
ncbi:hypothetical protein ACHAWF_004933 [Thalassiosira exigua]